MIVNARILIVDQNKPAGDSLLRFLQNEGFETISTVNGDDALEVFRQDPCDVLLADLETPGLDNLQLLREVKAIAPRTMCIVTAESCSSAMALEAMKIGAFDYLPKPVDPEEIRLVINRALEFKNLQFENFNLKQQLKRKYSFTSIVGDSRPMQEVFRLIDKVADSDSTVLIQGESGTGKELVARAIHYNSKRRDRYLVPVNCGAIPETLLESELFGHVRGAFTGATTTRIGRFQAANGGTLFLDEIGDMSSSLQIKVLRVLQEQEFEPVGSVKSKKVDVRIIAATNQDLDEQVAKRQFREDLYYRLSVIPLKLPPLRERGDDIPLLVNHFLKAFGKLKNRNIKPLSSEVMEPLRRYDWPGNVRELENLIERMVILSENGEITLDDLPEKYLHNSANVMNQNVSMPPDGVDFNELVGGFENKLIAAAMQRAKGNKNLAARLLNLKRTTLVEKIKKKKLVFD